MSSPVPPRSPRGGSFLVNAAALTIALYGLIAARDFFVPLMLAALLAFALTPPVRALRRLGVSEGMSVLLAALVILTPMGVVFYLAVSEIQHLVDDWPRLSQNLLDALEKLRASGWAERMHLNESLDPAVLAEKLGQYAGSGMSAALGGLLHLLSAGTMLLLILFFAIVMVASRKHLGKSATAIVEAYGTGSSQLVSDITDLIVIFLSARFGLTAITGLAGWLVMLFFGLPYAFVAGLFYGFMTWVPAVGLVLALAPPVALAVAAGMTAGKVALLVGLLLGVWGVQDHLLAPKWLGGRLKLNFLATYFALFCGERLWGPWGMFLSVPMLAVLRIIFAASPGTRPLAFLFSAEESSEARAHQPEPDAAIEQKAASVGLPEPDVKEDAPAPPAPAE